jgi:two-component system, cell cycle sensor histidine kinase and response regulator CckA
MRSEDVGREHGPSTSERVLENLAVGVIVHDADLRIVYTNGAAAALLGVAASDALQRAVDDPRWVVFHPSGAPVRAEEVPASVALRTKCAVHGMILGLRRPDGGVTWLAVDGVPLFGATGDVELVAVTVCDVTRDLIARMELQETSDSLGQTIRERDAALAQAVRELGTSEARYQAVLRAMSEGVAVHGPDGKISFANPAAQDILGLSLEQLQGHGPDDRAWQLTSSLGVPLHADQVPSEITRITGIPQRHTLLGVRSGKPAEHRWLSVSTDPVDSVKEGDTKRYSVVATFTDVTAERSALAAAQVVRDHLRDIAAALPGVVMEHWVGSDGHIEFRFVSAPVKEYFGVTPDEVVKNSNALWSCISPEDREAVLTQLRAPPEFAGLQVEFRTVSINGKFRHLRWRSSAPTRIAEGTLFRSVVLDVTEQRRLEETVREAQRREAIGTLAAGVAHNFNNMLAVIGPSLEFAKAQAPPLLLAELEDALTATRAATELVRQLMQLVRRDASDAATAINVSKLAEEVSQLCRRTFDSGIDIRCSVPPVPCLVLGRRSELQQALVNLCINARDALSNRSAPQLSLKVSVAGEHLCIEVTDNGAGMSAEVQRRIGEPFFTTKAPGRGTGLGLATVYGIVADLRGSMKCHSALGKGTRFELTFPRYNSPSASVPNMPRVDGQLPYTKVLLIDDEELVRNTLKRALSRANAEVLCAAGAQEGLELLESNPDVRLVILDLAMPELNGSEVLRRIRSFNTAVPVYLMTGFLPDGVDVSLANGVLLKPVGLARIRELLTKHATT